MEVRTARAEISPEGNVLIATSSQAPYTVRKVLAEAFSVPAGQIQVRVPFVGGGFGGKAPVMLEILAYLASRSVGGRPVRVLIPREQDMASAPCRMGLEAFVRLGADRNGALLAAEMTYHLDCGAYADIAPNMAKAIATDCRGLIGSISLPATRCASIRTILMQPPFGGLRTNRIRFAWSGRSMRCLPASGWIRWSCG